MESFWHHCLRTEQLPLIPLISLVDTTFKERHSNQKRDFKHQKYRSWTRTHSHLVHKQTPNHSAKLALNDWAVLWVLICTMHLTVRFCHVTYAFQSESRLYSCLNVKELLARIRRKIWSLSDWNWTRTHNHLVHKRTLNHLAKLAKWLSCVVSTYLYGAFDCMFLSCTRLFQARSSLTFRQL